MNRPSRARRESATTTLKNGRFLAPPRAKRITTMWVCQSECGKGVILRQFLTSAQWGRIGVFGSGKPAMSSTKNGAAERIRGAIEERFGVRIDVPAELPGLGELQAIAEHRSHRRYAARPVEPGLLKLLFACALSAPSKSDLQQADIVHV